MDIAFTIIAIIQLLTVSYFMIHLVRSFTFYKRQISSFKSTHTVTEVLLLILLIFCFIFMDLSSFSADRYFVEFAGLLLLSVVFYGINKLDFGKYQYLKIFTLPFIGTLFWLSLFTTIKFSVYFPLAWFPLYGIMALSPVFFALLSASEIVYHAKKSRLQTALTSLSLGLIPIVVLQLIMNLYTPEPWELLKMFKPPTQTFLF